MPAEAQATDERPIVPEGRFYFDGRRSFARIEQIAEAITASIEQVRAKIVDVGGSLLKLEVKNEDGEAAVFYCIGEIRDLLKDEVEICRKMDEDGFVDEGGKISTSIWNFWKLRKAKIPKLATISPFGKNLTREGIAFKYAVDRRGRDNAKVYDVEEMDEVLNGMIEKRKKIRKNLGLYGHPELGLCGSKDTLAQYFEVSEHAFKSRVDWEKIPKARGVTAYGRREAVYQAAAVKACIKDILEAEHSIKNGECRGYITVERLIDKYSLGMSHHGVLVRLKRHLIPREGIDRWSGDKLKMFNEKEALGVLNPRIAKGVKRIDQHDEFHDPALGRCLLVSKFLAERDFPREYKRLFTRFLREGKLAGLIALPRITPDNHVHNFYSEEALRVALFKFLDDPEVYKIAAP